MKRNTFMTICFVLFAFVFSALFIFLVWTGANYTFVDGSSEINLVDAVTLLLLTGYVTRDLIEERNQRIRRETMQRRNNHECR